jgi:two-component system CheB/CheR fusion protein
MTKATAESAPARQKAEQAFPVVAIGASAGGLEAITELLKNLSPETGMAYVYVQHLDPTHKSMLTEILQRTTKMKVQEAEHQLPVQPNHLYIIPPNKDLMIEDGVLTLNVRAAKPSVHMPVDKFFASLAAKKGAGTIGIVLSGNANDGTFGLRSIKLAGGLTFVQDVSARFQSMPQSAITEGIVDKILSPKEMAAELERLSHYPIAGDELDPKLLEGVADSQDAGLVSIIQLLKKNRGVDFSHYKVNTIHRRIFRRMLLNRLETLEEYCAYLKQNPDELNTLYQDMLINVTSFFRDPEAMNYIKETLAPRIIGRKNAGDPVRIWIPACATGEEAYSMAMVFTEVMTEPSAKLHIQVFASDLSETTIAKARMGLYTANELAEVSPERIKRFFQKTNGGYRVIKSIRDLCIFANHNVFKDPPFSRLDLVSCCNLMIYLDNSLQKKLISIFHYSLARNGFLILGRSEHVSTAPQLFNQLEKDHKIFMRTNVGDKPLLELGQMTREGDRHYIRSKTIPEADINSDDLGRNVDKLLQEFVPASVVVNGNFEILQFRGSTGLFLEPAQGKASLNLLKMARGGIGYEIRNLVHKVGKGGKRTRLEGLEMKLDDAIRRVCIEVIPITTKEEHLFLVIFNEVFSERTKEDTITHTKNEEVKQLQNELLTIKEDMRSIIEEQEASNEELQSANEEILSSNEELQSINEELETSKEEIESANEELLTINSELQVRNEQLSESHEYAEAVFETIEEAVLVLTSDFRVKSANQSFYKSFHVRAEETEGMMLYELGNQQWDIPRLRELLNEVNTNNTSFKGFEIAHDFPMIGPRVMLLNARRIMQRSERKQLLILAIQDITGYRTELQDQKLMHMKLEQMVEQRTLELKKAVSKLDYTNQELSQFAYAASHDLQEPLRKIITFSDRLHEKSAMLSGSDKEYLARIISCAERMRKLINDLLNFSRTSRFDQELVPTDLHEMVSEAVKNLDLLIEEKSARIEVEKLPVIAGIPVQLQQLFYNLISNSLKFSAEGKAPGISIRSKQMTGEEVAAYPLLDADKAYHHFTVSDNGIGFREEFAEKIFTIFQRLNTNERYDGSGVGLALCRKIAVNHRGLIYASSKPGEGSSFHILLPQ